MDTELQVKRESGVLIYSDTIGNLFTGKVYGKIKFIEAYEQKDTVLKIDTNISTKENQREFGGFIIIVTY